MTRGTIEWMQNMGFTWLKLQIAKVEQSRLSEKRDIKNESFLSKMGDFSLLF